MQLLSLALLRLNLLCFGQAELNGCDLQPMCCSTEVLSWGSSAIRDVKYD